MATMTEERHQTEADFFEVYGDTQTPSGRLVMVVENELTEASRNTLRTLLRTMQGDDDVTMVSGLSKASMLQADTLCKGLFYNTKEYISPAEAIKLLPWREIWLISGGKLWQMAPCPVEGEPH